MTELTMRACVLREPGRVAIETVALAPARAGEVQVRIAAAGVCHSDLHLVDGRLGEGRWPLVLGHEGAGVISACGPGVTHLAPGDPVVFSLVAPCGACPACRSGRRTLCAVAGARGVAGTMADGTTRLSGLDGTPLQHGFTVACLAEHAVLGAGSVIGLPPGLPLWQAALLGCGVLTGFGAVRSAGVGIGDTVAVIGCGGVGLQVIAAARLAGAGRIIAVDRRADKLEPARRRGATDVISAEDARLRATVDALTGGGVDHAFEVVGAPATIRLAWDLLAPGGTAVVVGLAAAGAEVALPAIEFLSEKTIRGSYFGSADPAQALPGLVELVRDERLALADVVSHVTDLDGVPAALERLRTGEGARTVAILDAALAGRQAER